MTHPNERPHTFAQAVRAGARALETLAREDAYAHSLYQRGNRQEAITAGHRRWVRLRAAAAHLRAWLNAPPGTQHAH